MDLFKSKKINVGDEEIVIKELSVGLLYKLENGLIKDDLKEILKECTSLKGTSLDMIGVSIAKAIFAEILKLTYGEPSDEPSGDGKKK